MPSKSLQRVIRAGQTHWVGDGFPVKTAFTYQNAGVELSPFLMLDHGAPTRFGPTTQRRGVGEHPHRGFETVSIVYQGEVTHRDSSGGGGTIGPGDVQWMTAGSGLVHEEFHAERYGREGGPFHMVQLWVNLPAKNKMTAPGYQAILAGDIPHVPLHDDRSKADVGHLRLIAGDALGAEGAARTFTPMQVWDVILEAGATVTLAAHAGRGVGLLVLQGAIALDAGHVASGDMAVLTQEGEQVTLRAEGTTHVLWLSGEPILEPIAGYGPFVMNTREEIVQAMEDFQAGRMGTLAAGAA